MRRPIFAASRAQALEILKQSSTLDMATTSPEGAPMLKTLNSVVIDDQWIAFHGGPVGEKTLALGQPVVISTAHTVALIPSHFTDPERACPATTFYRSVQVHGTLEEVTDMDLKASILQALMERHQPEGLHVPITAADPRYTAAVRGIMVARVSLEKMTGKFKLGQNLKPHKVTHLLNQFWKRGLPSDLLAIELVRAANPDAPTPEFLEAPSGIRLVCLLDERRAREAAALLDGAYWNSRRSQDEVLAALQGSPVQVGAIDISTGTLVGMARAITDQSSRAWVYDVLVTPDWRGRGVGKALMRVTLDHPLMRDVRMVNLSTRDADGFYAPMGFKTVTTITFRKWPSILMVWDRRLEGGVPEAHVALDDARQVR